MDFGMDAKIIEKNETETQFLSTLPRPSGSTGIVGVLRVLAKFVNILWTGTQLFEIDPPLPPLAGFISIAAWTNSTKPLSPTIHSLLFSGFFYRLRAMLRSHQHGGRPPPP